MVQWGRLGGLKIIPSMGDSWENNVLGGDWYDKSACIVGPKRGFRVNGAIAHLQGVVFLVKVLLSGVELLWK